MKKTRVIFTWLLVVLTVMQIGFTAVCEEAYPLKETEVSLRNSDFETWTFGKPYSWSFGGTADTKSCESVKSGRNGKAAMISKASAGYSILISSTVSVTSGSLYSYGAYIKTTNARHCRAYLMLSEQNSSGETVFYDFSENIYGSVEDYTLLTGAVYIPENIKKITVSVVLADSDSFVYEGNSCLYADDAFIKRHTPSVTYDKENCDFEKTVTESGIDYPLGWTARQSDTANGITENPPSVRSENRYYHSGSKSLYFGKDGLQAITYLENGCVFDVSDNYSFCFGGWYKSADSNSILRIDLLVYDESGNLIDTLTGNSKMLSHNDSFHDWICLSTTEKMPMGAKKAAFRIVFTSGKTSVYLDDLFCVPTENAYEKQVEFCDFHSVTENGTVEGWRTSGNISAQNNTAVWISDNDVLSHETEAFIPNYNYEISFNYTATAAAEISITGYDLSGNTVGETNTYLPLSRKETNFKIPFTAFEAVKTVIRISGNGIYTLNNYIVYETSTPANESGWSANWIWYPENAAADAVWQYRFFRTHIYLDEDSAITSAKLNVTADDRIIAFYVNGTKVAISSSSSTASYNETDKRTVNTTNNFSSYLKQGDNVIAFSVLNCSSMAGLLFEGDIKYLNGSIRHIASGVTEETLSSRLNFTQSHPNDYSSVAILPSDWHKEDLDDSEWAVARKLGIPPYGGFGQVSSYINFDTVFTMRTTTTPTVNVTAGEAFTVGVPYISAKNFSAISQKASAKLYKDDYCVATLSLDCSIANSTSGTAYFIGKAPDYLEGKYTLRLLKHNINLPNKTNNELLVLNVTACNKAASRAAVETRNGAVRLKINDGYQAPMMYLAPHYKTYYDYDKLSMIKDSDITLYCSYNCLLDGSDGMNIWTGNDSNGDSVLDYEMFDYQICRMLDLNSNGNLIVNIGMDAPDWWKEKYPQEVMKDIYSNSVGAVSFSSEIYREQAKNVITKLTNHVRNSAYKHRVVGIRLIAGRTYEWMYNGIENGLCVDYSSAALVGFRTYLKNKYSTDDALQKAWNNSTVTLSAANLPTLPERCPNGVLLDVSKAKNVIDFNEYLSQSVTDSLLCYAKAVKSVSRDLLVGAYYGYLWNFGSSDAIGSAHTTCSQVLESEDIDFIASPVNYSERTDGFDTGYMAASESVSAHGKLYILEQDNRSIYGQIFGEAQKDNPVGLTHTLDDSVKQLTRDTVKDFTKGNGLWYYDMTGGWFSDNTVLNRIKALKNEYDIAQEIDIGSNAQIAVFVGETTYNYFCDDQLGGQISRTPAILQTLYAEQRKTLSQIGADYDVYTVEDLCKGLVRDYKLNIVLSPLELSGEQRSSINKSLKTSGKTVLWIYLTGCIDGSALSGSNLSELIDISVEIDDMIGTNQAIIEKTDGKLSAGKAGTRYGNSSVTNSKFACIKDNSANILARYPNGSVAAAWKDTGSYTSVYSAVPGVSADFLISLCEYAGVHRYSKNKDDIIHTNNSYLSLYSMTAGEKTILLDSEKMIYDVLNQKYLPSGREIDISLSSGDTALFRLTQIPSDYNGGLIRNGNFYEVGATNTGYNYWMMKGNEYSNPNIIVGGSFEDDLNGWNTTEYTLNGATVEICNSQSTNGNKSLKMTLPDNSAQAYAQGMGQLDVEPNTEYTITYDLKIADSAQCYLFCYEFNNSGNATGGLCTETGRWSTGGKWETVKYRFTTGQDTEFLRIDLFHNGVAGVSYWDNLSCIKSGSSISIPKISRDPDNNLILENGRIYTHTLNSTANASYILNWGTGLNSQNALVSVYDNDYNEIIKSVSADKSRMCISSPKEASFVVELSTDTKAYTGEFSMLLNIGDFNNNNTTDAEDIIIQRKALLYECYDEFNELTGDGVVNICDLIRIKKYAANQ